MMMMMMMVMMMLSKKVVKKNGENDSFNPLSPDVKMHILHTVSIDLVWN